MFEITITVHEDIADDVEGLMQDIRKYKQCDADNCETWFDPAGMHATAHGYELCGDDCAEAMNEVVAERYA
jgi:hypothetical protein